MFNANIVILKAINYLRLHYELIINLKKNNIAVIFKRKGLKTYNWYSTVWNLGRRLIN